MAAPSDAPRLKAAYAARGARRMRRLAEYFRAVGRPCGSASSLMLVVGGAESGGQPGAVPIQAYLQRWCGHAEGGWEREKREKREKRERERERKRSNKGCGQHKAVRDQARR